MNIKTNLVKPVGVLAERQFIAKCINRQNKKRMSEFTKTVMQMIALFVFVGLGVFAIAATVSYFHPAEIKQLEKGEVIEMTVRVGGPND